MIEKNPIYYRVLGVGESTAGTINKINELHLDSVAATVVRDEYEYPANSENEKLVIILDDGDADDSQGFAQFYGGDGIPVLVITTGEKNYYWASTTHVKLKDFFMTAKAILDILFNRQVISLSLHDLSTALWGNDYFNIIEATSQTKGARVKNALAQIESQFKPSKEKNLIFAIYCNENSKPGLKMDEMVALHKFISKFPSDINVIWGFGYDPTIKNDSVRVILLAAGDE